MSALNLRDESNNSNRVIRLDRESPRPAPRPIDRIKEEMERPKVLPPRRRKIGKNTLILYLVVAGVLALFAVGIGSYMHARTIRMNDPVYETQSLVAAVGKHMALPQDEVPTIATVSDPSALKSEAFFTGAQVGDKVLMYLKARKAILYRRSEDKVLQVAPITSDQ
jgi:hypothetical protein